MDQQWPLVPRLAINYALTDDGVKMEVKVRGIPRVHRCPLNIRRVPSTCQTRCVTRASRVLEGRIALARGVESHPVGIDIQRYR